MEHHGRQDAAFRRSGLTNPMRPTWPRRRDSLHATLLRIDRAAARLNPYLAVLAIGLFLLNLTCLMLLAVHFPATHHSTGGALPSGEITVVAPGAGSARHSGI